MTLSDKQSSILNRMLLSPLEVIKGRKGGHGVKIIASCNLCQNIDIYHFSALYKRKYQGCSDCGELARLNPTKYIGQVYNKLTVVEFIKIDSSYKSVYKFLCECGNNHNARLNNVRFGKTNSCGCTKTSYLKKNLRRDIKEIAVNKVISGFCDRRRSLPKTTLTKKDVEDLIFKKCSYCKTEASNETKSSDGIRSVRHNGIDRVDSKKGYSLENCVPCCKVCNSMKSNYELDDFKNHILKLSKSIENGEF